MTDKDKLILEVLDETANALYGLGMSAPRVALVDSALEMRAKLVKIRELIELEDAHANVGDCD